MSEVTARRRRASRGSGEQLRAEIVAAAKELLATSRSVDAVSIRAVADAVGVTSPSIYLHFADKAALLLAVCLETFTALDEHIERAVAGIDDPLEGLRARGHAYVRFGLENPEHYRILFMTRPIAMSAAQSPEELLASAAFDHHLDAVQRAHDAGAIPAEVDPLLAAIGLWSGVHGITSLLIAKPDFPWPDQERLIDHVLTSLVRGLAASPQRSSTNES
jgi:AcrR family transcriptional regulator